MATKELIVTVTATRTWWFPAAYWVLFAVCRVYPSATDTAITFLAKHAFNYRVT